MTMLSGSQVVVREQAGEGQETGPIARLPLRGQSTGLLYCRATPGLAHRVAQLLSPAHAALGAGAEQDAVCELLNMVAESARTLLHQRGTPVTLDAPEVVVGWTGEEVAGVDYLKLQINQELLTFWLVAAV